MSGAPAELIQSLKNPRIVELRKLAQRKHRRAQQRFLVEGTELFRMAAAARHHPTEAFFTPSFMGATEQGMLDGWRGAGVPAVEIAEPVMTALAERDPPQGLLATFPIRFHEAAQVRVNRESLVLVLERLQDPGNLGTLIRTADAAGAAAIYLIPPIVDPFEPKSVRASMGSIFHVPIVEVDDALLLLERLRSQQLKLVGTDPRKGSPWGRGLLDAGAVLILGNEARGLSPEIAAAITDWTHLPIVGNAESLNVAVAGGILMYRWLEAHQPRR